MNYPLQLSHLIRLRSVWIFLFIFFTPVWLIGQQGLSEARALAEAGRFAEAIISTENVIQQAEGTLYREARLFRANLLAWDKRPTASIDAFRSILDEFPGDPDAQTGLGYVLLWEGKHQQAETTFEQVLNRNPDHLDAVKGLANTYLQSGKYKLAAERFEQLVNAHPESVEFRLEYANARLLSGQYAGARRELNTILQMDPGNEEAQQLLTQIYSSALEAEVWGGYSKAGAETTMGIRQVRLAYQFRPGQLIQARYDNALSLDNPELLASGQRAPSVWLGYVHSWNNKTYSRLDLGRRIFPLAQADENLVSAEQMIVLPRRLEWKLGTILTLQPGNTAGWLGWTALRIPLGNGFSVEPAWFYGKDLGDTPPQSRWMLSGRKAFENGVECTLGAFAGRQKIELPESSNSVRGIWFISYFPVNESVSLQAAAHWEDGIFVRAWFLSAGAKLRLSKTH